jgi:hypothetical protein
MVYTAEIRNNGTAALCRDALIRDLGIKDLPRYEPRGELPEHDLYIYVDDGIDNVEWECPRPNAYWAIDTHLGFDYRCQKAKQFDHVFCAQREGAEEMRRNGVLQAEWMPLACHPAANPCMRELVVHEDRDRLLAHGSDKAWDVVFVGFLNDVEGDGFNSRLDYLHEMCEAFPSFWLTTNCFFEDMAVRYARGRVGMNISIRDDLNMRFFEVMSTGTCLVTNRDVDGWDALGFEEGKHFVGFQGIAEMKEKIQWCLDNPGEREDIADAGHELVRAHHTYAHRMQHVLDICGVEIPQDDSSS